MKKTAKSNHWMVKQEPETYSWDDLMVDGRTDWTGVRNYQARNNLREMKTGDRVLFYHSSVMPLTKDEFEVLVAMGSGKNRKK